MLYTKEDLKRALRQLGLRSGMNIVLETSGDYSNVIGSEKALIDAIIEIIGYEATLLVPSFTTYLKHPLSNSQFYDEETLQHIEYSLEFFDSKKSLPDSKVAQQLLVYDDSLRSFHPYYSFLSWGKYAHSIISKHPLHFGLSRLSPIGKMMELGAYYLNINSESNVFFDSITTNLRNQPIVVNTTLIMQRDSKVMKELLEYRMNRTHYFKIMQLLEQEQLMFTHQLGSFNFKLISMIKTAPLIQMQLSK